MLNNKIKDIWECDAKIYDDLITENLSKEAAMKKEWADLILSYAPAKEKLNILDCGTGPGYFPVILGERGHHVTGIDLTENMIKNAKKNVIAAGIEADLYVMDCQKTVFPDHTFDLVVSRNITWTLSNPVHAYKEWKRILKPGGRLLIFDANYYLHLHDDERMKQFQNINDKFIKERGQGIFSHDGKKDTFESISRELFMSNKNRPSWDLQHLIEEEWTKVFAIPNIHKIMPNISNPDADALDRELQDFMPMFLIGAEK